MTQSTAAAADPLLSLQTMDSSDGIKRYRSMRALGTGTFGDVYHVKEALNDKDVALKAVDWQDLSE